MTTPELGKEYTRESIHAIFSPQTTFTPQTGTWGLQGMARIPDRQSDWVFFVTFGKEQGDHIFDESITDDGVLSWQSQPAQKLTSKVIQELIHHDERVSTIHLFLRTTTKSLYTYLGTLGYLTHDVEREAPVYFQWQLLDWPVPKTVIERMGLDLISDVPKAINRALNIPRDSLEIVEAPKRPFRPGVSTKDFKTRKIPNYAERDRKNRELGLEGEKLVLMKQIAELKAANRDDLVPNVSHVSVTEGDDAGYDIRSFFPDGRTRYIEVKTTRGRDSTPFFISKKEIDFSEQHRDEYSLIRIFEYDSESRSGKAFVLSGTLKTVLDLTPIQFRAEVRA